MDNLFIVIKLLRTFIKTVYSYVNLIKSTILLMILLLEFLATISEFGLYLQISWGKKKLFKFVLFFRKRPKRLAT